ncbi:hypothetical protein PF005_g29536 [Phytophthora fragariae]|uniref:Uncharacterized protein n=1 Tax=Phytophthora fragariae TaxID=53985 RepID=A0A6A3W0Q9_9STRA|nr:hypothetical protein PF003_g9379 [Phytophthora fragariae]KAE8919763.1 hypothetical protein PF009_g29935 [Phytophthora fragariae]KAE8964428.1 hypothetical protein PF011_g28671 [Phytophthora fragariae]KAE9062944.1 hypothetical protein PF010_g29192 [Phytophthora fragariae]KAE9067025.1 hypothetical protein PF007_g28222 [Phytophthora fragariae]
MRTVILVLGVTPRVHTNPKIRISSIFIAKKRAAISLVPWGGICVSPNNFSW